MEGEPVVSRTHEPGSAPLTLQAAALILTAIDRDLYGKFREIRMLSRNCDRRVNAASQKTYPRWRMH